MGCGSSKGKPKPNASAAAGASAEEEPSGANQTSFQSDAAASGHGATDQAGAHTGTSASKNATAAEHDAGRPEGSLTGEDARAAAQGGAVPAPDDAQGGAVPAPDAQGGAVPAPDAQGGAVPPADAQGSAVPPADAQGGAVPAPADAQGGAVPAPADAQGGAVPAPAHEEAQANNAAGDLGPSSGADVAAQAEDDGESLEPEPSNKASTMKVMKVVATAMLETTSDLGSWGPGDLSLGLYYLKKEKAKAKHGLVRKPNSPVDNERVRDMLFWALLIEGTYKKSDAGLFEHTVIQKENLLLSDWTSTALKPGHYIAVIPEREAVVVAIRGTTGVNDALTDLTQAQDDFLDGGRVHRGILAASRWFMAKRLSVVQSALKNHPGYTVHVVGHSLGGGMAACITVLLREAGMSAHGTILAPACTFDLRMCKAKTMDVITTLINEDDVIPRFSLVACENLRNELFEFNWKTVMMDDVYKTRIGSLAAKGKDSVASKKANQAACAVGSSAKTVVSGAASGVSKLAKKTKSGPPKEKKERFTENLYPPGQLFRIFTEGDESWVEEATTEDFENIELSSTMLSDHSSLKYLAGLQRALEPASTSDTQDKV